MEVTLHNFKSILPELQESINNAAFIAIDCELTGLNTISDINAYDTQKKYYEKVRKHCKGFLVIQYGICTFRFDKESKVFKHSAYNFYIFRRPVNKNIPDIRFLCQTSSIDFLISQGFDFNKLFKEGISFLNTNEETKYREHLCEQQKTRMTNLSQQNGPNNSIPIPPEDVQFIDDVTQEIEMFIQSDEKEKMLPRCNAFLRRLIYQTVRQKYSNKVNLESRQLDNKDRVLVVSKFKSKEEQKIEEQRRVENEFNDLDNFIGFSKVIKMLVDSNKLIIGHNMCLDLLHTIDKFLIPLPEKYDEFKECSHHFFPKILDTKYMSSIAPFRELIPSNVLGHLLKSISKEPFQTPAVEIDDNSQGYSLSDNKDHEAGFDAFITGFCFLSMYNHLTETTEYSDDFVIDFSILSSYLNRLFLMRLQDMPYIHLGGADPKPSRDHVLYISFPKEWKMNDIVQLFSPFGNVHIAWINDTSAYVGLMKRDQVSVALNTLSQSDRYTVISFAQRQILLARKELHSSIIIPQTSKKRPLEEYAYIDGKRKKAKTTRETIIPKSPVMESILEENEKLDASPVKSVLKRTISKTFKEDNSWD